MTDTTSDTPTTDRLRAELAAALHAAGTVTTPAIDAAIRAVPRHLFLPGATDAEAYADTPVYTKHDDGGASISAASQPRIVAMMLEQLQARPGDRVLEIGAGTGYNAALLAAITGDAGHVTTIDIDDDLVDGARRHLDAAGTRGVDVVHGDGALGHPDGAPYDRVVATVGAHDVPPAWLDQLAPEGRLVAPIRLAGAASRSIAFERSPDGAHSRESQLAVFMPLRGLGDDRRRVIDLTGTGDVTLQAHKDNDHATDPAALQGALDCARHTTWAGVVFPPMVSFEWLDLWLALRLPNPLMRMEVTPAAKERGLASPMFPTVAMATTSSDGSLAYLTIRPAAPAPTGEKRYEVGVIGHGPNAQPLAEHVAEEARTWDTTYRERRVHFAIPATPPTHDPGHGRFVLPRPHAPITVTWE